MRMILFLIPLLGYLLLGSGLTVNANAQRTTGLFYNRGANEGYTLLSPLIGPFSYLIDSWGFEINRWEHPNGNTTGEAKLLADGRLLRAVSLDTSFESSDTSLAGSSGRAEIVDWDGSIIWYYELNTPTQVLHHDVMMLPSGNLLMLTWDRKEAAELVQAGLQRSLDWAVVERIIEVAPDYASGSGGSIVWEWTAWDHFIQDANSTKDNYGVIADHPELLDINAFRQARSQDLNHVNGFDYNEDLDQIIFMNYATNELCIIDHSTTTAEAAGHTGGRSGKGGDLLYRWGNPQTYDHGTSADKVFDTAHSPQWIDDGLPGAGDIIVYHNAGESGSYFCQFTPPTPDASGNYSYTSGEAYGPASLNKNIHVIQSDNLGSAQVLPNGNIMACAGEKGEVGEYLPDGTRIWKYVGPIVWKRPFDGGPGPLDWDEAIPTRGTTEVLLNETFRAHHYAPDYPGLAGKDLTPGEVVENIPDIPVESEHLRLNLAGDLEFSFSSTNGQTVEGVVYLLEASDDLTTWTEIDRMTGSASLDFFSIRLSPETRRFYRVRIP